MYIPVAGLARVRISAGGPPDSSAPGILGFPQQRGDRGNPSLSGCKSMMVAFRSAKVASAKSAFLGDVKSFVERLASQSVGRAVPDGFFGMHSMPDI